GADVPVCLAGKPAVMGGIGERIDPLPHALPPLACVLINPRAPLPTMRVFAAFDANAPSPSRVRRPRRSQETHARAAAFDDLDALLLYMRTQGNDLEPTATSLLPVIGEIKAALSAEPGCGLAAMSGSGPTCFGIFTDDRAAQRAAH